MTYLGELSKTPEVLAKAMAEPAAPELVGKELVFCGCGTTFYLAQQAAIQCRLQGIPADAAEAIALVEEVPEGAAEKTYIFISRSGESMETVLAMEAVKAAGAKTFYIGAVEGSSLDVKCDASRVVAYAREALVLEAYSYYAQMIALLRCCGAALSEDLPQVAAKALELGERDGRGILDGMHLERMILLGATLYMPQLKEMMLKCGEITQKPSELWGILEFRHGPRSWSGPGCLIVMAPGAKTRRWDLQVAQELVSYGCRVIWLGSDAPAGARSVDFGQAQYSGEEVTAIGLYITALACQIAAQTARPPKSCPTWYTTSAVCKDQTRYIQ